MSEQFIEPQFFEPIPGDYTAVDELRDQIEALIGESVTGKDCEALFTIVDRTLVAHEDTFTALTKADADDIDAHLKTITDVVKHPFRGIGRRVFSAFHEEAYADGRLRLDPAANPTKYRSRPERRLSEDKKLSDELRDGVAKAARSMIESAASEHGISMQEIKYRHLVFGAEVCLWTIGQGYALGAANKAEPTRPPYYQPITVENLIG
ncbi:TPA: hypothetical protein EYO12_00915 [Candidatus Saccharibacteria bacterium]|jgi:hypothetical protein|nr:hypothetical protein [Candidatus Saccharibacteria bacterium]HIO87279.1 hypothetical protein [Candidatus Saccharibacteria bacterium]